MPDFDHPTTISCVCNHKVPTGERQVQHADGSNSSGTDGDYGTGLENGLTCRSGGGRGRLEKRDDEKKTNPAPFHIPSSYLCEERVLNCQGVPGTVKTGSQ